MEHGEAQAQATLRGSGGPRRGGLMVALWALYIAATLALIAAAVQLSRRVKKS